jgi:putative restriction endonuclease
MSRESALVLFDRLNVWSRGGQRAPHKPLLVLYALGRWARGERGDIPFREVDRDLTALLKEFGPTRQSYDPEYPFWRLQNDGVWAVQAAGRPTSGGGGRLGCPFHTGRSCVRAGVRPLAGRPG